MTAKVTILGSGTSTGVPVLGCSCAVCKSDKPKNNRTRASIMLEPANGPRIVIDTGPDFRMQMLRAGVQTLEHVFYTHCHADHLHGFDDLRGLYFNSQKAIHCYLDEEYAKEIRHRFNYAFENTGYLGGMPDIRLHNLPHNGGVFSLGGLEFETIRLPHGNVTTNAFRFGDFAYATDFKSFPEKALKQWQGKVKTMIASGLRWKEHKTHSTIEETLEIFRQLGVERGFITHLNHEIDYDESSAKMPSNVMLGYDGMKIEV